MPSCIETEKLSAKFPWTHRRRESVFSEKDQERSKHHHAEESLPGGVSLYHPDFCRVLVSGAGLRNLYECQRIFLCVPHAHEYAAGAFCALKAGRGTAWILRNPGGSFIDETGRRSKYPLRRRAGRLFLRWRSSCRFRRCRAWRRRGSRQSCMGREARPRDELR